MMPQVIEDMPAIAAFEDDSVGAQDSQVLRHCCLRNVQCIFQIGHRTLAVAQLFDYKNPQWMREHTKKA